MNYYNEFDLKAAAWLRELIKARLIPDGHVDERSIIEVEPKDIAGYTQHHFFAGIGGWSRALRIASWPEGAPVWTASLPCQPFSAAGKGLGKQDERHLLPHFLELVKKCRPNVIFGEQVERAIAHGWLDDLYAEMDVLGYEVAANVIPACVSCQLVDFEEGVSNDSPREAEFSFKKESLHAIQSDLFNEVEGGNDTSRLEIGENIRIGAAHIRQRLYWVANTQSARGAVDGLGIADSARPQPGREAAEATRYRGPIESASNLDWLGDASGIEEQWDRQRAPSAGQQEPTGGSGVSWCYCRDGKYRPVEPGILPLADGLPKGMVYSSDQSAPINENTTQEARVMRLKGYGNAIVPQVAAEFIRAFMGVLNEHSTKSS